MNRLFYIANESDKKKSISNAINEDDLLIDGWESCVHKWKILLGFVTYLLKESDLSSMCSTYHSFAT